MAETEHGIYHPGKEDLYNLESDLPKMAESVESRLTAAKGKLLVAQNTGAAVWEQLKGDGSLAEDGTLTLASSAKPWTWYTPSIIGTEQSRSSTEFGVLEASDEVKNVVLPTNGLIFIYFGALVKSSASAAGQVTVFLGANRILQGNNANIFANTVGTEFGRVMSGSGGLVSVANSAAWPSTGQIFGKEGVEGGGFFVFAAAGKYTVTVQYKASSGSITAKERKLWVGTFGV